MGRCPHYNVQQFTERCLDCGCNIYESDEEYEKHLLSQLEEIEKVKRSARIEEMEKKLGIKHPGNTPKKCI